MMGGVSDFRSKRFPTAGIDSCGKYVAQNTYWKLYAIENLFRIVIHSVLTVQHSATWWTGAVDPKIQKRSENYRQRYSTRPWHTQPGTHDIYYTHLSDLAEIIRANSHLFEPLVADVDQWIVKIDQILLPRNIVGHMNFPNAVDRQRIDILYSDCQVLVGHLRQQNLTLAIP